MEIIIGLAIFVGLLFIVRLFGAWMLRIDEVIKYQEEILSELKELNQKKSGAN